LLDIAQLTARALPASQTQRESDSGGVH
jgi:hypothetical protein